MPTVKRIGPFRFFFYSNEGSEPPHVHVETPEGTAKFWLNPVHLASSKDIRASGLSRLNDIVESHREEFIAQWRTFFNN